MSVNELEAALQLAAANGGVKIVEGDQKQYIPYSVHAGHLLDRLEKLQPGSRAPTVPPEVSTRLSQVGLRRDILHSAKEAARKRVKHKH